MATKLHDIKKLSVSFGGIFGTFTVRNFGEKAATVTLATAQKEANIVKMGAAGDSITMKQYDINTKILTVSVIKDSADDVRMKNIVALEEAGSSVVIAISYNDENTKERYATLSGSLKEVSDLVRGADMDQNISYVFNMPDTVHTPPSVGV
jgi:hypothetical protein